MLDSENQQRTEELSAKVNRLKHVNAECFLVEVYIFFSLLLFNLKLTIDMDKEIKDQNKFLGNIVIKKLFIKNNVWLIFNCLNKGFDFDSTGNLLKGGVNRISGMMTSGKGNRKMMFYLILGCVVGFIVLYKLFTKVGL